MERRIRPGATVLILLFFSLLLLPSPINALGQQEDPVERAEELISQNRLNEAILILEETIREDPERIHEAEDLLREIRRLRGSYNELFQQLIAHLLENPQDIETTLDIIDRMEAVDEEPNPRTRQQVAEARYIAQLAFDRDLAERRMNDARVALQEGRELEAIAIYMELRDLQRESFEERGYSEIFRNTVNSAVTSLEETVTDFRELSDTVAESSSQLITAVRESDSPATEAGFPVEQLITVLEDVSTLRNEVEEAATTIRDQREQVRLQFPDNPIDWYLVFQDQIARGRSEYRGDEGILPAVRQFAEGQIDRSLQVAEQEAAARREGALVAYRGDEYTEAAAAFLRMSPYFGVVDRLLAAKGELYIPTPEPAIAEAELSPELFDRLLTASFRRLSGAYSGRLSEEMVPIAPATEVVSETIPVLEQQKETVRAGVDTLTALSQEWRAEVAGILAQVEAERLPPRSRGAASDVSERMSRKIAAARNAEVRVAARIIELNRERLAERQGEISGELPEVAALVEGTEEQLAEIEEGGDVQISRYPDQALDVYAGLEADATAVIEEIESILARFEEEREYIREDELVTESLSRLRALLERSEGLSATLAGRIEEMEAQIAEAQQLREEADQLVAETRAALSALQVETARNLWEQAREAYYDSLSIQEDEPFREQVDELVLALGNDIQEAQNRLIVQEVRDLINEADMLYNQDEFGGARDALAQAEQLWSQVYVDPNTEVQRLLRLVNAALSIQEGRTLTETDPLFPVLGNYLNLAQQDFRDGRELYTAGRQNEGERLLNRAIENLRNIRDVRPLNWNARILELRILQITAEDNFPEVFEARYEDALDRIDDGELLAVYGELEALAEINPNYPGLQERIRELEIELNLRENPIDQARVAESNQLYQQAQRLADAGSRDQAVVAVSLLEEAVDLNPNNQDATFLMDSLRIRIGGQATVALDSADEQQYRLAETLFSQGQVARAFSIVERLLAEPDNQGYPPLIELRRRIALRLGI